MTSRNTESKRYERPVARDVGGETATRAGPVPIRAWTEGVPVDPGAQAQLERIAQLPFIHSHIAVMPDVHWGRGATVGSVIPMKGAIVPAAVGVDIGCGMAAVQTSLTSSDLPDDLAATRSAIEAAVPHGRTGGGRPGNDKGAWQEVPDAVATRLKTTIYRKTTLERGLEDVVTRHPKLARANIVTHLGTLGTGNHFVEVCLDEADRVWVMLHSGSRGIGAKIGTYFMDLAKQDMRQYFIDLPDEDLAYFPEGTSHFYDYVKAAAWAQAFAKANRAAMMEATLAALAETIRPFEKGEVAFDCHHNYVAREEHFGAGVWVTRKGAVRAQTGELGIIPGSMGAKSHIVVGKGNPDSFQSCAHGAGRKMSRARARDAFSVEDHIRATEGVECRKDIGVVDETPGAYKDIDQVMAAQTDLVDIAHTLRQIVCVKG